MNLLRNRQFWLVVGLGLFFGLVVYADLLRGESPVGNELQLMLFALQQVVFLSVVALATWRFSFRVGFLFWVALGLVTIPYAAIFLTDNWQPHLLLEMLIIGFIGMAEVVLINAYEQGRERLMENQRLLEDRVKVRTMDLTKANLALEKDIVERRQVESELRDALNQVKTLTGLLPICANCKKIRDDKGYWSSVEKYISTHSEAEFTHGICPDCLEKLYPSYYGPGKKRISGKLPLAGDKETGSV
ncbi:histidine kinase [Dehalogenimonas sp. WBC-2]|nr:histidine kinase [Dehalogenimonas sp. WBC-2]